MDPTLTAVLASWQWRPDVALVVGGLGVAYVTGWRRLRRRNRGAARPWELGLYLSGLAVIVLALLSPLDTFAAWLFTLHILIRLALCCHFPARPASLSHGCAVVPR